MGLRNIGIVYKKELTEALRDRRTLITTLVVPLLMIPVLMVGFGGAMSAVIGNAKKEKPKVMIIGGGDSPAVVNGLKNSPKIEIVPSTSDWKDKVVAKEVRAAVEIPAGFEARVGKAPTDAVKIYTYGGEIKSELAAGNVEEYLKAYRDEVITERLTANHLPAELLKPFEVKTQNIAPPAKVAGALLGGVIAYLLIFMCLNGGMHPAIDLTAGEKERGTMETILSSPVSRTHLVIGKFLLVLTASLVTALLLIISLGTTFGVAQRFKVFGEGGADTPSLTIGPLAIASVFIMAIPLAVLFSAILITIAVFAKTHKEAQSYIMPMMFLVIIPAMSAMLPGVELTLKLAIVPLLNMSLLCKQLVTGEYHWNYIALIFISTSVYAAGALFLAVKMFQRESVLLRS